MGLCLYIFILTSQKLVEKHNIQTHTSIHERKNNIAAKREKEKKGKKAFCRIKKAVGQFCNSEPTIV